jgi:hypothetical protein
MCLTDRARHHAVLAYDRSVERVTTEQLLVNIIRAQSPSFQSTGGGVHHAFPHLLEAAVGMVCGPITTVSGHRHRIERAKSAMPWRGGTFAYFHPDGRLIRDKETLIRIRSLAIPSAWQDIWICRGA